MSEIDHEYTDEIVCLWCGVEWSDSWEMPDYDTEICYECGKAYSYERHIEVHYSTKKTKDEA